MRALAPASILLMLFAAACELGEVSMPAGRDVLVVEAVLRAEDGPQHVVIHRSIIDNVVGGEPDAHVVIVTPEGEITLPEAPLETCARHFRSFPRDSLEVRASCYSGPVGVHAGATYHLRVTTRDGLELRGQTTVPGDFDVLQPQLERSGACRLAPQVNFPVVWSASRGAWAYLPTLDISGLRDALAGVTEAPDSLQLTAVAVSAQDTTIALPKNFGLFDRFDLDQNLLRALQDGFPPGVRAEVRVTAADRNYVNGVRGGAFNPSGNIRFSSVVGDGLGIFGSVVVRAFTVEVGDTPGLPPCVPD
jgi:hypothetical protein